MHRVNTQFDIVAFSFNFHSEVIGGSDGIDYFPMKVASLHEYVPYLYSVALVVAG